MAIAFDAFSAGDSSTSPNTIAHTVATPGANVAVYALILNDTADTVTGVTYDGNAMAQRGKHVGGSGTVQYIYEWIGTAGSGSKNIVASSSSGTLYVCGCSFTGVSAFDAANGNEDFGTTNLDLPITTVAADCFAVAILYDGGQSSTPTARAGTTKAGANGDYIGICVFYSTASLGAAGAKTLATTVATGGTNEWAIVSFSPASGGAAPAPSVNDAVTLAESVTMLMDLKNTAANDSVTVAESQTMHMPISLRMEKLS